MVKDVVVCRMNKFCLRENKFKYNFNIDNKKCNLREWWWNIDIIKMIYIFLKSNRKYFEWFIKIIGIDKYSLVWGLYRIIIY